MNNSIQFVLFLRLMLTTRVSNCWKLFRRDTPHNRYISVCFCILFIYFKSRDHFGVIQKIARAILYTLVFCKIKMWNGEKMSEKKVISLIDRSPVWYWMICTCFSCNGCSIFAHDHFRSTCSFSCMSSFLFGFVRNQRSLVFVHKSQSVAQKLTPPFTMSLIIISILSVYQYYAVNVHHSHSNVLSHTPSHPHTHVSAWRQKHCTHKFQLMYNKFL